MGSCWELPGPAVRMASTSMLVGMLPLRGPAPSCMSTTCTYGQGMSELGFRGHQRQLCPCGRYAACVGSCTASGGAAGLAVLCAVLLQAWPVCGRCCQDRCAELEGQRPAFIYRCWYDGCSTPRYVQMPPDLRLLQSLHAFSTEVSAGSLHAVASAYASDRAELKPSFTQHLCITERELEDLCITERELEDDLTSTRGVSAGSLQAVARAGASTQNQRPSEGTLAGTNWLGFSLTRLMPSSCTCNLCPESQDKAFCSPQSSRVQMVPEPSCNRFQVPAASQ